MVLQLCGRVCRRLSFENPSSIDEGFFVTNKCPDGIKKPPHLVGFVVFILHGMANSSFSHVDLNSVMIINFKSKLE